MNSSMLFKTSQRLFKRMILKKLVIEPNIISKRVEMFEKACVISSPSAWSFFSQNFTVNPAQLIQNQSLQHEKIINSAKSINENVIIGIGGGGVLDRAKAIAKIGKKKCILIPTILSTTAWLNRGASIKDGSKVYHAPGKFDEILLDPQLIALAPQYLNIGGISDILCGYNSLSDWILAKEIKGERLPKNALEIVLRSCNNLKNSFETYLPITPDSIQFIASNFMEALGLCWGFRSGRPIEGSEHFLYYALEELYDKPMNHGAIIALNTLVCLRLRGNKALIDPSILMDFYKRIGISYSLSSQGIPQEIYARALKSMLGFVKMRNLKYSLWNLDNVFENHSMQDMLRWIS